MRKGFVVPVVVQLLTGRSENYVKYRRVNKEGKKIAIKALSLLAISDEAFLENISENTLGRRNLSDAYLREGSDVPVVLK